MKRLGKVVSVDEVKELERQGLIDRKLKRAPMKDTVTVPDGGYTIVRFHADNPGKTSWSYIYIYASQQTKVLFLSSLYIIFSVKRILNVQNFHKFNMQNVLTTRNIY